MHIFFGLDLHYDQFRSLECILCPLLDINDKELSVSETGENASAAGDCPWGILQLKSHLICLS